MKHSRERAFHDIWAASIDPAGVKVLETFAASTSPEQRWLVNRLGDLKGKSVLELGSGAGEAAVYFALRGARVTATDLSPGMLDVVARVAAHYGVKVERKLCSAEDLGAFEDCTFDVVYGANVLHHVDVARCLDEVKRVLKPAGKGAFCDPLAYNPVINIYRRMARAIRTADEHPLVRSDVRLFTERFRRVEMEFFWLATLLLFLKFYLIDRIHPSQDRYWKRIISHEQELRGSYQWLEKIDRVLLWLFPIARWWCWNIAICVYK